MSTLKTNTISTNDANNVALSNQLNLKSYTTTARDALTSVAGDMIYNSTTNKVNYYNGSSWSEATPFPALTVSYLVVAAGGGAPASPNKGGGGAGGYRNSYASESSGGGGSTVGAGGVGLSSSIDGTATYRAGGGGGSSEGGGRGSGGNGGGGIGSNDKNSGGNNAAGSTNTGGGAGGTSGYVGSNNINAKNGGSGVVIIRFPSQYAITVGAGLTATIGAIADSSDKVVTFTEGTGNISFAAI